MCCFSNILFFFFILLFLFIFFFKKKLIFFSSVVGFGLLGVSALILLFSIGDVALPVNGDKIMALEYISGFAFGASSIALFARVAGGKEALQMIMKRRIRRRK